MALTDIVYDNGHIQTMDRGNIGTLVDVNSIVPFQHTIPSGGTGPSVPTGGGVAVKITDGIIYHVRDDQGNVINKPIVVM